MLLREDGLADADESGREAEPLAATISRTDPGLLGSLDLVAGSLDLPGC